MLDFNTDDLYEQLEASYQSLAQQMADPEVAADAAQYVKLTKEFKDIEPRLMLLREERQLLQERQDNEDLYLDTDDSEFRSMIHEENDKIDRRLEELEKEIKLALIPKDPLDEKSVIMEIRAGTGGEEAALFAAELYQMYLAYAESKGWTTELLDANETELGGMKDVVFSVKGENAYSNLKFESGTHRVQRVPETESGGRIQTSAVTVAVLPEADEVDININPADLNIDTYRSSGAGGQHVNKTSSAIRITHLPTGIVVTCQDERSQHKNRDKAMAILRSRLLEMEIQEQNAKRAADRKSQVGSGDRSERIRTYNFPQGRVTDHRVNLSQFNIDEVMHGQIQAFIMALQAKAQEDALKEMQDDLQA